MEPQEAKYLIIIFIVTMLVFLSMFVILFLLFQKKKLNFLIQQEQEKLEHERQLIKTKIEIAEENTKYISQELHDNVGQILSVAAMEGRMAMQQSVIPSDTVKELVELTTSALSEIRSLSRTLNPDYINEKGLEEMVKLELDRVDRLKICSTEFSIEIKRAMPYKLRIMIFRIIQEFISNTVKHAQAKNLSIDLQEDQDFLYLIMKDDGVGFDVEKITKGNGLINLNSRLKHLNGTYTIQSKANQGTILNIKIPAYETKT